MPKRKNDELTIDDRRRRVAGLYLHGHSQREIAAELECGYGTVQRDLVAIQEQWLASASIDFDAARAVELAKLDELERTYWAAWERSLKPFNSTWSKTSGVHTPDGPITGAVIETTRKRERRDGNPAYLAGVERCVAARVKLLGLDEDRRRTDEAARATAELVRQALTHDDTRRALAVLSGGPPADRLPGGPGTAGDGPQVGASETPGSPEQPAAGGGGGESPPASGHTST